MNEHLAQCGKGCELTCENPKPRICSDLCTLEKFCVCDEGFVRFGEICIEPRFCPKC